VCFFCRGICSCAQCRRKRGEIVRVRKRPSTEGGESGNKRKKSVERLQEVRTSLWDEKDSIFFESTNPRVNDQFMVQEKRYSSRNYTESIRNDNMKMNRNYVESYQFEESYYLPRYTNNGDYFPIPSRIPEENYRLVPLLYEDTDESVPFCFSKNYPLYKYQGKENSNFIEFYSKWRY